MKYSYGFTINRNGHMKYSYGLTINRNGHMKYSYGLIVNRNGRMKYSTGHIPVYVCHVHSNTSINWLALFLHF